jgi:hypothetical protein
MAILSTQQAKRGLGSKCSPHEAKINTRKDRLGENAYGTYLAPFGYPPSTNEYRRCPMCIDFSGESHQGGSGTAGCDSSAMSSQGYQVHPSHCLLGDKTLSAFCPRAEENSRTNRDKQGFTGLEIVGLSRQLVDMFRPSSLSQRGGRGFKSLHLHQGFQ